MQDQIWNNLGTRGVWKKRRSFFFIPGELQLTGKGMNLTNIVNYQEAGE
jgi:hypothetical protein